jgi:hypothetical protein
MTATRRNGRFSRSSGYFRLPSNFAILRACCRSSTVVTVNHSLGAFLRGGAVDAVEIDGLNKIAVAANQVCSIVRHCGSYFGG